MADAVKVTVNGDPRLLPAATSVDALVALLGLAGRRGIAVAVGDQVVPRSQWPQRLLTSGEAVVLIQATQGG